MIVGLMFIAIIWCLRGFLSYKQVVHNSCNMGTRGLPDIYTLSPRACDPRALDVYIRQTTRAHVTTIIPYNLSAGTALVQPRVHNKTIDSIPYGRRVYYL